MYFKVLWNRDLHDHTYSVLMFLLKVHIHTRNRLQLSLTVNCNYTYIKTKANILGSESHCIYWLSIYLPDWFSAQFRLKILELVRRCSEQVSYLHGIFHSNLKYLKIRVKKYIWTEIPTWSSITLPVLKPCLKSESKKGVLLCLRHLYHQRKMDSIHCISIKIQEKNHLGHAFIAKPVNVPYQQAMLCEGSSRQP